MYYCCHYYYYYFYVEARRQLSFTAEKKHMNFCLRVFYSNVT